MAERSVDREREDTYRNKVLEDTKTTREEDRKTRVAEREFDRKEAEKRLEAEKALRERELALRIRQLDDAKARGEKEDARAAELERTRTRMSTFDRHFKAGTEMSPEDVAAEIEDLQGRDELDDDGQVRLDALRRAYSVQRSVMRNIRGKRVSIDPNDPLTRTEEPTLSQGVDLPEVGAVTREVSPTHLRRAWVAFVALVPRRQRRRPLPLVPEVSSTSFQASTLTEFPAALMLSSRRSRTSSTNITVRLPPAMNVTASSTCGPDASQPPRPTRRFVRPRRTRLPWTRSAATRPTPAPVRCLSA